jgi:hypothetical protein
MFKITFITVCYTCFVLLLVVANLLLCLVYTLNIMDMYVYKKNHNTVGPPYLRVPYPCVLYL